MKLRCPSKTFLLGEYAVLAGAPAILLATPPCFSLEEGQWNDPYQGAGGFGASGAAFVFDAFQAGEKDAWSVWQRYRASGLKGSGADVVLQWTGKVTYFCPRECKIEKLDWPFKELSVGLIHTGHKVLTHEHLKTVTAKNFTVLEEMAYETYFAMKQKNSADFIQHVEVYGQYLEKMGLVCDNTKQWLQKLQQNPLVLAAKGCGAMGADVILCLLHKKEQKAFARWCTAEKLNLVFCGNQFAEGVSCKA
jgi:mevalonate kinase